MGYSSSLDLLVLRSFDQHYRWAISISAIPTVIFSTDANYVEQYQACLFWEDQLSSMTSQACPH